MPRVIFASSWILLLVLTTARADVACDRACLMRIADNYLNALTSHDKDQIRPDLAANSLLTENGALIQLGDGLWSTARGFPTRQTFADPASGQIAIFAVAREANEQFAHVAVRLKVVDRRITEIETIAPRPGDHSLFEPNPPPPMLPLWSTPVAASSVLPRAKMIELADDYFETLLRGDPRGLFSPDCDRSKMAFRQVTIRKPAAASVVPKVAEDITRSSKAHGRAAFRWSTKNLELLWR